MSKPLKECLLTTYVSGEKYMSFIPLLVYSCKKAYPEYDIMLFLFEELGDDIKEILRQSNLLESVYIKEKVFNNKKKNITALESGSNRWVLFDSYFLKYKYIYIIDVDMFYIREPKPLHIQHSERMQMTGLPFDNLMRYDNIKINVRNILKRLLRSGGDKFSNFILKKDRKQLRLSGLHFIDVQKYYIPCNINKIEAFSERLHNERHFFPELLMPNDEALLYYIVTSMGYDCSPLGTQTNAVNMLDFNNNLRKEFRPHHGLHLGIFKNDFYEDMSKEAQDSVKPILESDTYRFYVNEYIKIYKSEEFQCFFNLLPMSVKIFIERVNAYYDIK